jgi:hypothetical protein
MPEPVFYFRGMPPVFEQDDPAMDRDLKLIAGLPVEQVNRLADSLRQETGFLDYASLKARIDLVVLDGETAKAVLRAIQRLEADDVDDLIRRFERRRSEGKVADVDDAKVADARRNLSAMIVSYPALARFEKAQALATLTGQRLESADLICDLRPIFDKSGDNVEGMMPYTRLRVIVTGADGLPTEFEAELSVAQVYALFDSVKKAKAKLATLRACVTAWLPDGLPDVPLTRIPKGAIDNA